jgi:hypothetical protein
MTCRRSPEHCSVLQTPAGVGAPFCGTHRHDQEFHGQPVDRRPQLQLRRTGRRHRSLIAIRTVRKQAPAGNPPGFLWSVARMKTRARLARQIKTRLKLFARCRASKDSCHVPRPTHNSSPRAHSVIAGRKDAIGTGHEHAKHYSLEYCGSGSDGASNRGASGRHAGPAARSGGGNLQLIHCLRLRRQTSSRLRRFLSRRKLSLLRRTGGPA